MITTVLVFIAGLVVLIKGSDFFIESTARIAKRLGVSEFIIGLTFVSIGTTLPELTTSIVASYTHNPELIIGNVVGSNIANIGLILGLAALRTNLNVKKEMFNRDGLLMLGVSAIFFLFSWDRIFSRTEGLISLVVFFLYLFLLFELFSKLTERFEISRYARQFFGLSKIIDVKLFWSIVNRGLSITTYTKLLDKGFQMGAISINIIKKGVDTKTYGGLLTQIYERIKTGLLKDALISIVSIFGVFFGAKYMVSSASEISLFLGIPETIIGLVMVAIGTSLPELMVSLSATRKGFVDIMIGNVIGANILNITLNPGIASLISPIPIAEISINRTMPAMILFSLMCVIFMRRDWKIKRHEGAILLGTYLLFLIWLMM